MLMKLEERRRIALPVTAASPSPTIQNVPQSAHWEDIRIRMKTDRAASVFCHGALLGEFDCADFLCAKRNTSLKIPSKQWRMLQQLALLAGLHQGFIVTISALAGSLKTTPSGLHHIKGTLSENLRTAFGVLDDPFLPYDAELGYRPKFQIEPEAMLRIDELHGSGGELFCDPAAIDEDEF